MLPNLSEVNIKENLLEVLENLGVFSFNGNKIVTCGGGGVIVSNNVSLAEKAKYLTTTAKKPHPYEYFHDELGYNYQNAQFNAALACAQLEQLDTFLSKKRVTCKYVC